MSASVNANAPAGLPKLGLLEEDDEFPEFSAEEYDESMEMGNLPVEQWDADWDDEQPDESFANQLRAEIQKLQAK